MLQALDERFDAQYDFYLSSVEESIDTHEEAPSERLFQITDASSADWALRKIGKARQDIHEISALADEEIARLNLWRGEASEKHERTASFFESLLVSYHRRVLADDPTRKQIKFPHGRLNAHRGLNAIAFAPEFIEWAKENAPELLRVKHEVEVGEAKKVIAIIEQDDGVQVVIGGQIAPGVTFTPGELTFKATTDGAE